MTFGAGLFDSSSALLSARLQGSLSLLMKKRVDLLQITDAENRLTQLGCTFPNIAYNKGVKSSDGHEGERHKKGGWGEKWEESLCQLYVVSRFSCCM